MVKRLRRNDLTTWRESFARTMAGSAVPAGK